MSHLNGLFLYPTTMRGIKKAGYGNVYKDIMSNPDLSLQAKGVYAYLSSFTGDQEYCFPSYDTSIRLQNIRPHTQAFRQTKMVKRQKELS